MSFLICYTINWPQKVLGLSDINGIMNEKKEKIEETLANKVVEQNS